MKVEGKSINKIIDANANQNESKRLKQVSKDFEAMFLSFMLKSLMKISDEEKSLFGGDNFGADILDSIFLFEISRHIAKNGKFGIAELVSKQLESKELKSESKRELNKNVGGEKVIQKRKINTGYGKPMIERINRFDEIIKKASSEFDVPEELIKAIIAVESSGDVFAMSPKGAKGLMQLVDSTAQFVGVKNVWHPVENIYGGVKYLRYLLDKFNGDLKLALAGYNAGPENVLKFGGIPPFPETIEYVSKVVRYMKLFQKNKNAIVDAE